MIIGKSGSCHKTLFDKFSGVLVYTRDDPEIRGKRSPFLHLLTNRAEDLEYTTATHMQLICHSMNYVSRLRALQLSSRQRYIA